MNCQQLPLLIHSMILVEKEDELSTVAMYYEFISGQGR